jgi:hypothetical protein
MTKKDDLRIFLNILAQSPEGLNDPHLIAKFSKAQATLHQIESADMMNSQNIAPTSPVQAPQSNISAPMGDNVTQGQDALNTSNMPQNGVNQPISQQEGNGSLNLPQ